MVNPQNNVKQFDFKKYLEKPTASEYLKQVIEQSKYPTDPKYQYSSDLLQQSFTSEKDLKIAEQEYKKQIQLPDKIQETYDPRLGMYVSTRPEHQFGTSVVTRQPTIDEIKKIDLAQYTGDLYGRAITGVPAQMLGGVFTTPMTEEQSESITGVGFYDPRKQFDIFKSNFDAQRDLPEAERISGLLENLNTNFEKKQENINQQLETLGKGNIQDNQWVGSEKDLEKYNKLVENYNKEAGQYEAKFDAYSSTPEYQRAIDSPERKNIYQRISDTELSATKKTIASGVVGVTDFATFRAPPVRVIRGGEMVSSGAFDLTKATTPTEKLTAGGEMALGGLIAVSGIKGGTPTKSLTPSFLGTGTTAKVVKTGIGVGVPAGFSVLYGASIYKQTEDLPVAIGAGVGGFLGIKSPEIIKGGIKVTEGIIKQQPSLWASKKGQAQLSKLEGEGELIYDYSKGKWYRKTLSGLKEVDAKGQPIDMTGTQARGEFARAGIDRQVNIIKKSFEKTPSGEKRVYLDRASFEKDIQKARNFMKESGLNEAQIERVLTKAFPEYFKPIQIQQFGGLLEEPKITTKQPYLFEMQIQPEKVKQVQWLGIGKQEVSQKQLEALKQDSITKQTLIQSQIQSLRFGQATKQREQQKSALGLTTSMLSKSLTQKKQESLLKNFLEMKPKKPIKQRVRKPLLESVGLLDTVTKEPTSPKKPKEPIKKITLFDSSKEKKGLIKEIDEDEFEVFVKKRGEDISIGEFKTLPEAKKELFGELRETLRAGGFIKRKGEKVKVDLIGTEFGKSKVDPFRIIEPKRRRIKKGTGEISEILKARKRDFFK